MRALLGVFLLLLTEIARRIVGEVWRGRKEGLVVVPGLGRKDRLDTVVNNIRNLEGVLRSKRWDCIIYTYAQREFVEADAYARYFWSNTMELKYLSSLCTIVENPGKRVTEHLHMVQPALIRSVYEYVFVLLDDCKIESMESFQLDGMVSIMKENRLTVASPKIVNANKGGGQAFRSIMYADAPQGVQSGSPGYVVSFIEIFALVMTMDAYTALWELLCPSVNPYGWGYDFWYNNYAKDRVKGHKMGIVSRYSLRHEQVMDDVSSTGRSDTVKKEDKWQALVVQERYYQHHYGTRLHKFRETLDLRNFSWNGAVLDFLRPVPHALHRSPSTHTAQTESRLEFLDTPKGRAASGTVH